MSKISSKKSILKNKRHSVEYQNEQNQEASLQKQNWSETENEKIKHQKQDLSKVNSNKIRNSIEDSLNMDLMKDESPIKKINFKEIPEEETEDKNIVDRCAIQNESLVKTEEKPKPENSNLVKKDIKVKKKKQASTLNRLAFRKLIQDNDSSFKSTEENKTATIDVLKDKESNDFKLAEILSTQKIQDQPFLEEAINKKKAGDKLMLEQEMAEKDMKNREILEKFRQLLKNYFEAECLAYEGWKIQKSTKNLSVSSKSTKTKTKIIKAIAIFENTEVLSVFNYLMDPYNCINWDKDKIASHGIYKSGTNANIQYIIRAMPLHVTPRDALLLRFWECLGETCLIYQSSIVHKKIPKSVEYIRAKLEMSGFRIKQNINDVVVNFVMEADPMGRIPNFMHDTLIVNPCFNFFKKLLSNYKEVLYNDKFIKQCNISLNNQMFKNLSELDIDDIKIYMEQYISKNLDRRIPSSLASVRKLEQLAQASSEPKRAIIKKNESIVPQKQVL